MQPPFGNNLVIPLYNLPGQSGLIHYTKLKLCYTSKTSCIDSIHLVWNGLRGLNFISLVTCFGLQEEEPLTAHLMSSWASHIATSVLMGHDPRPNHPIHQQEVGQIYGQQGKTVWPCSVVPEELYSSWSPTLQQHSWPLGGHISGIGYHKSHAPCHPYSWIYSKSSQMAYQQPVRASTVLSFMNSFTPQPRWL